MKKKFNVYQYHILFLIQLIVLGFWVMGPDYVGCYRDTYEKKMVKRWFS